MPHIPTRQRRHDEELSPTNTIVVLCAVLAVLLIGVVLIVKGLM